MAWLSGWAEDQRVEVEIDNSKIDATLTDFPVLLKIGPASGIGATDLTSVLDALAYPFTGDDFTGSDSDPLDSDVWGALSGETPLTINGNKARGSVNSGLLVQRSESKFLLSGDFDIQVDFDMVSHPETNNWKLGLLVWDSTKASRVYIQRGYSTTYGNHYEHIDVPGWTYTRDTGQDDLTGKLRLVRSGTTITSYAWYSFAWQLVKATSAAGYANDMHVYLSASVGGSNPTMVGDYDNFVINSGTIVWPQGSHPNRKKLAVTTDNGVTECKVEIEHWDAANELGILWVKVPSISSSAVTTLYIYYDSAHADNTTYVGDIGDTPAKDVWSNGYFFVMHMAEFPAAGGFTSKDSVGGLAVGWEGGGLHNNALVDMIGNGYDYIAANSDWLSLSSTLSVKSLANVTLEMLHTPDAWPGSASSFLFYESTATTGYSRLAMYVQNTGLFRVGGRDSDTGTFHAPAAGGQTVIGTMKHLAGTWDSATNYIRNYMDGAEVSNLSVSIGAFTAGAPADTIAISSFSGATPSFADGKIDEVRVSSVMRSAAWIKATNATLFDNLVNYKSAWITGFSNRAELTIDSSKIDAALTDFPAMIKLSTASGLDSKDLSAIFDELDYPLTGDNFTGTNGDAPNTDLWSSHASATIQNNKLNLPVTTGDVTAKSYFSLSGDFDIQADFDLTTYPATCCWSVGIRVRNRADTTDCVETIRCWQSAHEYRQKRAENGSWTAVATVGTSDSSGKFRLTRVGNVFHSYYWNGSSWTELGTGYTAPSWDTLTEVWLNSSTWSTNPSVEFNLDNFVINSGTVVWPQGTHPNRKKIAVATGDGTTECKVEIEFWDAPAQLAFLHVKVPSVSSSVDTLLYLYYDSSHAGNTANVGDIGDTPAQAVWDSDFLAVFHFAEYGATPATITDSSGGGLNLTTSGQSESDDNAGLVGRAGNFDGSADYAYNVNGGLDLLTTEATWEVLFAHDLEIISGGSTYEYLMSEWDTGLGIKKMGIRINFYGGNMQGLWRCTGGTFDVNMTGITNLAEAGESIYVASSFKQNGLAKIYTKDGTLNNSRSCSSSGTLNLTNLNLLVGGKYNNGTPEERVDGKIDDMRISKVERSAAWIRATRETLHDNLITFSMGETGGMVGILSHEIIHSAMFGGQIAR